MCGLLGSRFLQGWRVSSGYQGSDSRAKSAEKQNDDGDDPEGCYPQIADDGTRTLGQGGGAYRKGHLLLVYN